MAYIIALMNMILHGVDAPNIVHLNTLTENILEVQDSERHDVILANPPFGGKERQEVQNNFPIKTSETAYLFLQHFIKLLKAGGRAGVVIKNTFLSNVDNASVSLRKELLETCNLHTILDLPGGTFPGAGVKTVVLFFEKGSPSKKIQYYQLNLDRNIGKGQPLNLDDLDEFINLKKDTQSENTWTLDIKEIDQKTFDLGVINPHIQEEVLPEPSEILKEIEQLEKDSAKLLNELKKVNLMKLLKLKDVCSVNSGISPPKDKKIFENGTVPFYKTLDVGRIKIGNISDSELKVSQAFADSKIFEPGTILFPKSGASTLLNHRVVIQKKGLVASTLAAIVPIKDLCLSKYLYYYLLTIDAKDFIPERNYPGMKISEIKFLSQSHLFKNKKKLLRD